MQGDFKVSVIVQTAQHELQPLVTWWYLCTAFQPQHSPQQVVASPLFRCRHTAGLQQNRELATTCCGLF